jgi:hypothetical protein
VLRRDEFSNAKLAAIQSRVTLGRELRERNAPQTMPQVGSERV